MPTCRRSTLVIHTLLLSSLLLLLAAPAPTQDGAQEAAPESAPEEGPSADRAPSEPFLDTIDVDVVNVEVVVTDGAGNPIRGLTRDDFTVREDGRPVELTNFYAVEGARRAPPGERSEAGAPAAAGAGGFTPLPADQRLHLVVLVDDVHIGPGSRGRILNDLEEELDRVLRPGDRVLVARATPELDVVQPFTGDPAEVSAAIDRVRRKASRGALLKMEERGFRRDPDASPTSMAAQAYQLNRRLLAALHRFVEAMAGLPGRRAVLFVSEGMAVRPVEPRLGTLEAGFWDATVDLVRLTRAAAGSHVTFYTLDAASGFHDGLDPDVAEVGDPSRLSQVSSGGGLADLAWRTGGASVPQGGSTEAILDRMASDYRDYYSLGYRSRHSSDGEYHRIEVEVPGRRVQVRHTRGFRATTPAEDTVERTMSALVFDESENPLGVRVELGREKREARRQYVLPVLVRVPISSLTLFPGGAIRRGSLSVVVVVQDAEGGLSPPQHLRIPVEVPEEKLRESSGLEIGKGINLLVGKGESKLAVGVRDELSGTTSTLNVSLSVGGR